MKVISRNIKIRKQKAPCLVVFKDRKKDINKKIARKKVEI